MIQKVFDDDLDGIEVTEIFDFDPADFDVKTVPMELEPDEGPEIPEDQVKTEWGDLLSFE